MRDPYEILGLAKTASAAEIKSAFRKLAKKFHPDQSKEPKAKDRFAEIGSAYEILGDGKKRAPQFEGFGASPRGAGASDFRNFNFDFGPEFSPGRGGVDPDILAEMFGGGRTGGRAPDHARGEDVPVAV